EYNNNHFIDNMNAHYTLKNSSTSKVSDAARNPPLHFYNTFIPGQLNMANFLLGNLNPTSGGVITITSLATYGKVAPVGCKTNAVIRVTGFVDAFGTPANVDLTVTAASQVVVANQLFTENIGDVSVKLLTAAAGCSTFPSDFNVSVGYKMGVSVTYVP
ncbi:MAG: hypothetical protein M3367_06505, partial [Acidobacteriota bacterium]|nr:hypothetical protein [Acidobacteriota bacterium]